MMVPGYTSTLVIAAFVGWLTLISLGFVGYLSWANIKDLRRQRQMEAERQRLGLRPGAITRGSRKSIFALARLSSAPERAAGGVHPCSRSRARFQSAHKAVCAASRLDSLGVIDGLRGRSAA